MKARTLIIMVLLGGIIAFQAQAQEKEQEKKKQAQKEEISKAKIVVAPPAATWTPDINIDELRLQSEELEKAMQEKHFELQKSLQDLYVHVPEMNEPIIIGSLQDRTSSSLMLTKRFDGESAFKKSTFEVEKDQKLVSFQVNGSCETGEIQVIIKDPAGKKVQEIIIDPSARIQWNKSLTIIESSRPERIVYAYSYKKADEEKEKQEELKPKINEQYLGTWTIEVNAKNAKGEYVVKISTR